MVAQLGRAVLIKVGDGTGPPETYTTVGGLRTSSLSMNNEMIDITNKDSGINRDLLAGGIQQMSISGTGVFLDDALGWNTLEAQARAGTIDTYQFIFPDYGTYEGEFLPTTIEMDGQHDGEATYAVSFESSGPISFTAA